MTETIIPQEKKENINTINQINLKEDNSNSNNPKSLIKSILDSKDLTNLIEIKLQKYKNYARKVIPNRKDKDYISKLEEGYESSDSGDSVQSTSTILTSTSSSTYSGMSYFSKFPDKIDKMNNKEKDLPEKRYFRSKIFDEIKMLKTVIPKEKSHNYDNNTNKNEIITNNEKEKEKDNKININSTYPLEYFEIFPDLKKYQIGNDLSGASVLNPILFIKNLISKNYHESLCFTKEKLVLQNFKNSIYYDYKIMEQSQPFSPASDNDNITCMITGYFMDNNIEKKNKMINDFNEDIKKLSSDQIKNIKFFFFGYKSGLIRQTALIISSDEKMPKYRFLPYREYKVNDIIKGENKDKDVLSMSLSDDQNYLLSGYASCHFIIWKTTNGKTFYIFDEVFKDPVVACEFLSEPEKNKEIHFLVGDSKGKVYLFDLKKNFFKDNFDKIILSKCFYPCLLLKKLKFNNYDRREDFKLDKLINKINKLEYLCVMGNLEYIEIFSIKRKLENLLSMNIIKNPDLNLLNPMTQELKKDAEKFLSQKDSIENLSQIEFPDACFGLGYIGDLIKFRDENDNNKEFPEILLAVSWKNLIRLFLFNETLDQMVELGWYMNNCSILKIDFIDVSLLYLLDKNNNIKIINIKLFNSSFNTNYKIEKERKNQKRNKYIIPITDITNLENHVKMKNISKAFTETIDFNRPFIVTNNNNIYIIEDKINKSEKDFSNLRNIHLKSYREFLDETMKENSQNWPLFFSKFIDIMKISNNTLGLIPENKEKRENLLIEKSPKKIVKYGYLKKFLEINKTVFDEDEDQFNGGENNNFDYLSIAIEFAIEIGVEQLETFILDNKFLSDSSLISKELINDIINQYLNREKTEIQIEGGNEKLFNLDLILCHFHYDILKKVENIEKILGEYKLNSSIIYYYSNALNDFITPLKYLFSEFKTTKQTKLPEENFALNFFKRLKLSRGYYRDNYNDLLKSLKTGFFNLEDIIVIIIMIY